MAKKHHGKHHGKHHKKEHEKKHHSKKGLEHMGYGPKMHGKHK